MHARSVSVWHVLLMPAPGGGCGDQWGRGDRPLGSRAGGKRAKVQFHNVGTGCVGTGGASKQGERQHEGVAVHLCLLFLQNLFKLVLLQREHGSRENEVPG